MRFYENSLKAYVEMKEEDGKTFLYIEGLKYPVRISLKMLKQYPDWVEKDTAGLLARQIYRKNTVNRLADTIIKERQ